MACLLVSIFWIPGGTMCAVPEWKRPSSSWQVHLSIQDFLTLHKRMLSSGRRSAGLLQPLLVGGLEQADAVGLQGMATQFHVDAQARQLRKLRLGLGDPVFDAQRRLAVVAQCGERLVGQGVDAYASDQRLDVQRMVIVRVLDAAA